MTERTFAALLPGETLRIDTKPCHYNDTIETDEAIFEA
jgi:hypothetical protein